MCTITITINLFQVFNAPTKMFSKAETPLIGDVLPVLDKMQKSLTLIQDSDSHSADNEDEENEIVPDVIRVAAQAALLLLEKYWDLMMECDLYIIAMGTKILPLIIAFCSFYCSNEP
jgi:hypothetical protein